MGRVAPPLLFKPVLFQTKIQRVLCLQHRVWLWLVQQQHWLFAFHPWMAVMPSLPLNFWL